MLNLNNFDILSISYFRVAELKTNSAFLYGTLNINPDLWHL